MADVRQLSGVHRLDDLLARQAAATPQATALVHGETRLSYAELVARAAELADRLRPLGAGPGRAVGVLVGDDLDAIVALLGVLRSGAAYVPLDPALPAARLRAVVADVGPCAITGSAAALRSSAEHLGTTATTLAVTPGAAPDVPAGTGAAAVLPADTAYVIYTSGSTGTPKGCPITHANVLALLRAAVPLFDVGPDDRWTLFHSLAFDFSVWELWGAFATGARVVAVDAVSKLDARQVLALVDREQVSVLNQVPSFFRALVRAAGAAALPASLRYVVFGGEAIDVPGLRALPRGPRLVNMYGLTESTVHTTFCELTDDVLAAADATAPPIGTALPHLEIRLVTDELTAAPPGQDAEMLVSGASVATGYLRRPELTADRFVRLDLGDGDRLWYRTGDLARQLPDGGLGFRGRADAQVKLRGYRIELTEVEHVLRTHPAVRDAAAWVQRTDTAEFLYCAVVLEPGTTAEVKAMRRELHAHAAAALPRWAMPNRFDLRESLPHTPSGKLDRAALAADPVVRA